MVKYNFKTNIFISLIFFVLGAVPTCYAQYNEVDISKDHYEAYTGHMKMGTDLSPSGQKLSYTNVYLTKNGKPWMPVMGEMNYGRTPHTQWEEGILKMKAAGIQVISTYVVWINHEETEGQFNWSDNNDLAEFAALCKKHGLYLWLRIGPWSHFETRNGGFPDWLLKKHLQLRTNDEQYLKYVAEFFTQINHQVQPFYFKNGGTIIGIQLENEMETVVSENNYQHMLKLKEIALKSGFDVPYYSIFAAVRKEQREFLPMIGGYGDSPWAQNTAKIYKGVYYFTPLGNDADIGSDLFGQVDTRIYNSFPSLSAEIGTGLQVTYHRRNVFTTEDVLGPGFTRLGSGINGLGYFMFHGGITPTGKYSSLQESRATNYPNDVALKNYNFQAPIGPGEELAPWYHELKLVNWFIKDFGEDLVTRPAFFPKKIVQDPVSNGLVRVAVRSVNNSGFIFLSNHQRLIDLPDVKNFQVSLSFKGSEMKIPSSPVNFRSNKMMIWPFNLMMEKVKLIYATTQLVYKLNIKEKPAYVFYADQSPEMVFDASTITSINGDSRAFNIKQADKKGRIIVTVTTPGKTPLTIVPKSGKSVTIFVLSKEEALDSWKITNAGGDYLFISKGAFLDNSNSIIVQKAGEASLNCAVYPDLDFKPTTNWTIKSVNADGAFSVYKIFLNKPDQIPAVAFKPLQLNKPAYWIKDSTVLNNIIKKSSSPFAGADKIWSPRESEISYFRKHLTHNPSSVKTTILAFSGDDYAEVFINGKYLSMYNANNLLSGMDISGYLNKGDNVIAVKVVNHNNGGGFVGKIYQYSDAEHINAIVTNTSWLSTTSENNGWSDIGFDDKSWTPAALVRATGKQIEWKPTQPGPLYGNTFQPYPSQRVYELSFPALTSSVKDIYATITYDGDMAAFYQGKELIYDDFNDGGDNLRIRLGTLLKSPLSPVTLQLFPLMPYYDLYIEDHLKTHFWKGIDAKLRNVKLTPLYQLELKPNK